MSSDCCSLSSPRKTTRTARHQEVVSGRDAVSYHPHLRPALSACLLIGVLYIGRRGSVGFVQPFIAAPGFKLVTDCSGFAYSGPS